MERIYFAKKFRTTEAESKSRMTEHERKGTVHPHMSGEILLPVVTRPEIFPAAEKYKRVSRKSGNAREEDAPATITWRKSRSINDVVPARQCWRLSRTKGAVGHRVLTPTNQFTSPEKSFAKTREEMTASSGDRENRITVDNISHCQQFAPQTVCFVTIS